MKKIVGIFLVLVMLLSVFAGCSGSASKDTSSDSTKQSENEAPSTEPQFNEFGWEIPKETIEFSYYSA